MKGRKILTTSFFILLAVALAALTGLRGQEQTNNQPYNKHKEQRITREALESQFPITDYEAPEPTDPEKVAKKKIKGKRYDKLDIVETPTSTNPEGTTRINDWEVGVTAIPSDQSNLVIIGEVTDAQAHVSEDKTGVYSEFQIHITDILKNDSLSPLTLNSSIVVERTGGRIKFPTGKTALYRIHGQGMLRQNKQYVLFLKREGDSQDYSILTGYELSAGKVIPVDGSSVTEGDPWIFDKYRNADATSFLQEVRKSIANTNQASANEGR